MPILNFTIQFLLSCPILLYLYLFSFQCVSKLNFHLLCFMWCRNEVCAICSSAIDGDPQKSQVNMNTPSFFSKKKIALTPETLPRRAYGNVLIEE